MVGETLLSPMIDFCRVFISCYQISMNGTPNDTFSDPPPQVFQRMQGFGAGGNSVVYSNQMQGASVRGLPLAAFVFEQPMVQAAGSGFAGAFDPRKPPPDYTQPQSEGVYKRNFLTQPPNAYAV